jgi:hypothetical protein
MPFFFHKTIFFVGVATLVFGHQVGKFQKNMLLIIRGAFRLHFPNALGEPPTPNISPKDEGTQSG